MVRLKTVRILPSPLMTRAEHAVHEELEAIVILVLHSRLAIRAADRVCALDWDINDVFDSLSQVVVERVLC